MTEIDSSTRLKVDCGVSKLTFEYGK